ncbi:MAG: Tim44 domain-containing protein [Burkholderiaceae bacterium]|nr:Tim44 domain-containing protein [Burkholderiaceae bacterium]MBP8309021.1 Tim44 domain-containing protein [Burkholderiaceae bacterium]
MRQHIAGLAASVLIGFTLVAADAEAARLGGGRNVGRQSPSAPQQASPQQAPQQGISQSQQAPAQAAAARPGTPAAAAQPARNRWLGPIAGLAAGLGLAALFSHLGLGAEMANFMMIALLVLAAFVVFRLIMSRRAAGAARPVVAAPGYGSRAMGPEASVNYAPLPEVARTNDGDFGKPAAATLAGAGPAMASAAPRVPAGFDVDGFLKGARQQFVRLQAAFDSANLAELKEFTADELYPELSRQITERGTATQRTDVVQLEAELLGVETQGLEYVASVRFHGMIREVESAAASPFDEVWNLTKPMAGGSGWLLAGIQQLS